MQTRIRRELESGKVSSGCLIIVAVVIVVVIGGGYMLYRTGVGMLAEMVQVAIRDNPVVLEHIGNIEEIEFDVKGTAAFGQKDILVFNVEGSKGSGELRVVIAEDKREGEQVSINQGSLRMADGQTFDLFPGSAPAPEAPQGDAPKEGEPEPSKPGNTK